MNLRCEILKNYFNNTFIVFKLIYVIFPNFMKYCTFDGNIKYNK